MSRIRDTLEIMHDYTTDEMTWYMISTVARIMQQVCKWVDDAPPDMFLSILWTIEK